MIGRDAEQRALSTLLDAARSGTSGALVVEGEPGVGKSALLAWALENATDFQVIRCSGAESEVELPYGGLSRLLRPLHETLHRLSAAQVGALQWIVDPDSVNATARPAVHQDRFTVGAAVLALLAAAAEWRPILALIDDVQWLDESSVDALTFLSRRLLAEGVLLLFSQRTGDSGRPLAGLPSLTVTGLAPDEAARLLATSGVRSLAKSRVEDLVAATNGNPLALLELPRLLSEDELAGFIPDHQPLPIADALMRVYSRQFDHLSEACRQAATVVALLPDSDLLLATQVLAEIGLKASDLGEAEDAGLIELGPTGVTFRHPLARSAAAYSVPAGWRRRVHAAIGASLLASPSKPKPVESAWHLAAAALEPDEATAALLEQAAEHAATDSEWAVAAMTFQRAGQLSVSGTERYRRLVLAGNAAFHAGLMSKCEELLDSAEAAGGDKADTSLLASYTRLRLQFVQGRLDETLVTAKAVEAFDGTHALEVARILGESGTAALYVGKLEIARSQALRAMDLAGEDLERSSTSAGLLGLIQVIEGDFVEGRKSLSQVIAIARAYAQDRSGPARDFLFGNPHSLQYIAWFANGLFIMDEFELAADLARAVLDRAREWGVLSVVPFCLTVQASVALRTGDWKLVSANVARAAELAQEMELSLELVNALAVQAQMEARYGGAESCRKTVELGLAAASRQGNVANGALIRLALGMLEFREGDLTAAIRELEVCRDICQSSRFLDLGYWHWAPELIEAYVSAGANGAAQQALSELTLQAERTGRPILWAFSKRCEGLLNRDYQAFDEALVWHEQCQRPFDSARTLLCYGERLRRDRKRATARRYLQQAWRQFRALGADAWAERAEAELTAAGVQLTATGDSSVVGLLSPQELQVALAVVEGATNREVAAQLYLSPKTIEYHLKGIFRKLQVGSRAQLREALDAT